MSEIPYGYCHCGCGQRTRISDRNWARMGYVKGEPFKYIPCHTRRAQPHANLYRQVRVPGAHRNGWLLEHVVIAERVLGRKLPDGAQVHHVDENKRNNAHTNLVICQDQAYHYLLHARARVVRAGGNPNTEQICCKCRRIKPLDAFNRQKANLARQRQTQCRDCAKAAFKDWAARNPRYRKDEARVQAARKPKAA